jgi:hypothetical protein
MGRPRNPVLSKAQIRKLVGAIGAKGGKSHSFVKKASNQLRIISTIGKKNPDAALEIRKKALEDIRQKKSRLRQTIESIPDRRAKKRRLELPITKADALASNRLRIRLARIELLELLAMGKGFKDPEILQKQGKIRDLFAYRELLNDFSANLKKHGGVRKFKVKK